MKTATKTDFDVACQTIQYIGKCRFFWNDEKMGYINLNKIIELNGELCN